MWNPKEEAMPPEELRQLQWERLQATLNRVYRHVHYYRKCFDDAGLLPEDLDSIEDLGRLPFTNRSTLMDNYPYGMFAVPLREVVRIHSVPAWTGEPIVVGYTRNDLEHWSDLVARMLHGCGVNRDDVVQISFGYGILNRGLGLHYGAERLGSSVIPGSTEETRKQILIMRDYRTTVYVCSPSYALHTLTLLRETGLDPKELCLRIGIFGGEPWEEDTRLELEQGLLLDAFDHYAVPEMLGPGIAGECRQKQGLHIAEDHFLAEIIDPASGRPLPPGVEGELVLTSLTREAYPLIRFRTGDLTSLDPAPCPCGRTLVRMAGLKARDRDVVRVNGMLVHLARIRDILAEVYGGEPRYQVMVEREHGEDHLEIRLEMRQMRFQDEMKKIHTLRADLIERLREALRVRVSVTLHDPRSLAGSVEKFGILIDKRFRAK
jgi:phenylacetate-CoA ligase